MEKDDSILSLADRVIEILRDKGCIELDELARCTDAELSEIKRIIDLLEKEDLAIVEYHFTKRRVIWKGERQTVEAKRSEERKSVPVEAHSIEISGARSASLDKRGKFERQDKSSKRETERYYVSEPVIKLTDYAGKDNGNNKDNNRAVEQTKPISPLNIFIPKYAKPDHTKPDYADRIAQTRADPSTKTQAKPILTPPKNIAISSGVIVPVSDKSVEVLKVNSWDRESKGKEDASVLSSELKQTMGEIQTRKQEIAKLNKEETQFFEERYVPLNKKLETEIGIITDTIIEKENEIEKQKIRAKALIESVNDVEVESLKIHDKEIEARKEFETAMVSLERLLDRIREIRKGLGYEVKISKKMLAEQVNELKNINASMDSLTENEVEVERKIKLARSRIEEEERGLESLRVALSEMRKTRETIKNRMKDINEVFGMERMKEIEEKISNITQLESKLEACRQEYSNAIGDLKKESKENAESIEKLRETIQMNFVRKAALELDRAGKEYESKVSNVFEDEKKLRRQIEAAKVELRDKIEYAKELSRKLKEIVPQGRDITDTKMMQELKEIERMEMEAEKEEKHAAGHAKHGEKRVKLLEDIKSLFSKFKEKINRKESSSIPKHN